jgi:hypothetical protein
LVAINYFTKWVEAASYSTLKAKHVARFIENNIICRYGVPHEMIFDNGMHFENKVQEIFQKYGIQHHKSSPYRLQMNGAVEVANKNVKVILEKTIEGHRNWVEKLPFALWGYCTSIRTSTGATPLFFSVRNGSCFTRRARGQILESSDGSSNPGSKMDQRKI